MHSAGRRDESGGASPARRRFSVVRVLALLAVAVVLTSMSGAANRLFYHPTQRDHLAFDTLAAPAEEVRFASGDGTGLHGLWLHAAEPRGTVVHFHGNAENVTAHARLVDWLPEHGLDVFMFDYRGFGRSEGRPTRAGLHADSIAALDFAAARAEGPLFVFGQSLGGACALAALADRGADDIAAIAVEGTFASYRSVARAALGGGAWTRPLVALLVSDAHSPADGLARLAEVPLLVVHGERDEVVPIAEGRALYEGFEGPKRFWEIHGMPHLTTFVTPWVAGRECLVDFFRDAATGEVHGAAVVDVR